MTIHEALRKKPLLFNRTILAASAFLIFSAPQAIAETSYFDLSPEQLLNAEVVSASKKQETVAEAPAAVYVITKEDIARSGMTSVPELLRMAPGVEVARSSSNTWAISIRGFNQPLADKILVMIDGRTVYNPLFAGTFWEAQDVPLDNIERIEVIRGPGGTLWGANAVNGVINIITKNASETQGNLVSGGGGNYEKDFVTARHGGTFEGGDAFYNVYAKESDHGPFDTVDGAAPPHDAWNDYRSGFRADWGDENSPDHVSMHGDVYHVTSNDYNNNYSLIAPYSSIVPETYYSNGANFMEDWKHTYDDSSSLKIQYYVDYTKRVELLLQDSLATLDIDTQYNLKQLGRHEIIVGGDYRVTSDDTGGSPLVTFDPQSRTSILGSGFVQDKITLQPEHWFLTVGSKLEHNVYTGFEVEPNARLEWTPDTQQTAWTSVSRAVRTPDRIERDLDITNVVVPPNTLEPTYPSELVLTQNTNFGSEDLVAYEAGYRRQITHDFSVDTAVFANDYTNLQSITVGTPFFVPAGTDPAHYVFPVVAVNQMTGEVYGAELAATWKLRPDWKLSAGYSRLDMYLHAPFAESINQETEEGQSPKNQFNLRSYWNINDAWTFDTAAYYVGALPQFQLPAYTRIDANLGWDIKKGLRFNLVGQNLFDGAHREFGNISDLNASQVPRSIFGKLTWQF
jgi:iron complex outermembrane receptor protein